MIISSTYDEQLTQEWQNKWKYSFRRMGIFDTITLADWQNIVKRMHKGICPRTDSFWYLDQWHKHPVRVNRISGLAIRHSRIHWKYVMSTSPLYFTPHALGRYRERTGSFVDDSIVFDVPYVTDPFKEEIYVNDPLSSYLLPTKHGAWLGHSTVTNGFLVENYEYKRNKWFKSPNPNSNNRIFHFYCVTFIREYNMSMAQREICRAYENKDYQRYDALNKENAIKFPSTLSCYKT